MEAQARHLAKFEQQALAAMEAGRLTEAMRAWGQVLTLDPRHVGALTQIGQGAFGLGDFAAAREAFQRAAELDGQVSRRWVNLALACQKLGDEAAEEAALYQALVADPLDLMALFLRGALYERQGKMHRAASAYGAAANVAPPMDRLQPALRPAVLQAIEYRERYQVAMAEAVDRYLEPHLAEFQGEDLERFRLSLDILLGRKQRYDPQPMRYYMPHLPVVEFFDRTLCPWMEELEASTDAIRLELMEVLRRDQGMEPYIRYAMDEPLAQWRALNHSPDWSAFHLWKDGMPVAEAVEQCPQTVAAWRKVPSPDQPGRTPVMLYSLLKPKTHIPAHVGASNVRSIAHLPLVIPEGCRFRVGNSVRNWTIGQAWVFDDTIEHEAWNDSDQLRAILIFDVWNPLLSDAERRLITVMNQALNHFGTVHDLYDV